ncbi:MAG: glycosyltransferase family 4 protein [Kiritimatiellae bacterium]|nr:glycosyltransferase family 4 protein [Kiritimatiellia bacterium]
MKILQILPALGSGGVERGTVEIARALAAACIPNAVASEGGPRVAELEALGVPHFALPLASKNPFVVWRNAARLADLVRREGFSILHVRSRAPAWSALWAARRSGATLVATYHGVHGISPRWLKIPYNRVMTKGARVIAVSNFVRRHLIDVYGVPEERIVRIYRGADTRTFRPDAVSPSGAASLKDRLGFPRDMPVVTLPGRLTRLKGQGVLLEALRMLSTPSPVGCLFVGSDQGRAEYSAELRAIAASLPANRPVAFLDHTDDMPAVYAMSDIVVSATVGHPEAFGRTIPEAQAMGVLVVGTAHGGACETIDDGATGFLVPPGDAAALAAKLDEMLSLPPGRKAAIRAAALESVRTNFSTERMCAETIALYRSLDRQV